MSKPITLLCPDNAQEILESPMIVKNKLNGYKALMVDKDMLTAAFVAEYSAVQTNVSIITPPAGYRACVRDIIARTDGNAGTLSLDFITSGKIVDRHCFSVQNRGNVANGHIIGAIDEPLTLNIAGTGTSKVFLRINYVFHK